MLGVEAARPRLSWTFAATAAAYDQHQIAYQLLVASDPKLLKKERGDLWDSGRVASSESVHVPYSGVPLVSRQACWWSVRVWDDKNRASGWSQPARWEMGLLNPDDWKALWIGSGPEREPRPESGFFKSTNEWTNTMAKIQFDGRSTLLRKDFVVTKPLRRAEVYATGLGYYELTCNGKRVGDQVLAPAKTNYRRWVLYDLHDLKSQLRNGTNTLGIMLGNGWFNPYPDWWQPYRMQWFGSKRAILQLHLDYTDGTSEIVATDGTWKTAPGPVLASCVYDGELYDAVAEQAGWKRPGFDATAWPQAHVVEPPGGRLRAQLMPPIRVVEERRPVGARTMTSSGAQVFDLGQNFAGWVRINTRGPRGTRIVLRYAEDLKPDGSIDVTSNEKARATDKFVLKGTGGVEVYEPHFTFHGFRYVEVSGQTTPLATSDVVGCVVHTDCKPAGAFSCDNPLVNRIHNATVWAQRSNLMGYPMDCPQRDERLGWFGDAMVTEREALLNFDTASFYRHWLGGIRQNQNPANGDISIVSPRPYIPDEPDPTWTLCYPLMVTELYRHTGDRGILAEHFDAMSRYLDYLGTQATNNILPKYWIGDWGTIVEGWQEGDPQSVNTVLYAHATRLVASAAKTLGKQVEADKRTRLAESIEKSCLARFYDPTRKSFDQGTQFSNALPLALGLIPEEDNPAVLANVIRDIERRTNHFNVGVLGTKYLIDALTAGGRPDIAWRLVNQTGYPSWAHLLEGGRTTLSEFWDLHGSHNHVMLGSIDSWFYNTLAGIQTAADQPGFAQIVIAPYIPESLSNVTATVRTVRGPISVDWHKTHGTLTLNVSVPPNATAEVRIPTSDPKDARCEPSRPITRTENTAAVYRIGSGHYRFQAPTP